LEGEKIKILLLGGFYMTTGSFAAYISFIDVPQESYSCLTYSCPIVIVLPHTIKRLQASSFACGATEYNVFQ
jgi:hypothetical protein